MVAKPPMLMVGPAAVELFGWLQGSSRPHLETLFEGPAGTGKTHIILQHNRAYLERYPRTRILMMRDRRVDMTNTVLVEWEEEILGLDHPAVLNGPSRAHREKYTFPNGSEAIIGGFNNETKIFSGQYHGIYFNECQETVEEKWETLHRALRAKGGPYRFLVGDCNPDDEGHWLNLRADTEAMKRVVTRLWHNPRFFRDGEWTEDGREYAQRLKLTLTGANFLRLYQGIWAKYEGLMLPQWDPAVHLVYAKLERDEFTGTWYLTGDGWKRELRWFYFAKDVGHTNPGVLQVWGVDPEGRRYRVREYYRTAWTHADWAQRVVREAKLFNPHAMVSDHDQAMIAAINRALIDAGMAPICRLADKNLGKAGRDGKIARIELLRAALKNREIFWVRDAVLEPDPALQRAKGVPWCSEMEMGRWTHREYQKGEDRTDWAEEPDPTQPDHGIDAALYGEAYNWGRSVESKSQPRPGTAAAIFRDNRLRALGQKPEEVDLWR